MNKSREVLKEKSVKVEESHEALANEHFEKQLEKSLHHDLEEMLKRLENVDFS